MTHPSSWIQTNLGTLIELSTGKLDANAAVENGEYPFFTCSEKPSQINTYAFDTDAVLLAGNGSFGVKHYKGKFNAYQRTYVIEAVGISSRFLYWLIKANIHLITENERGSTIPYIRKGDITDIDILLPPLNEQIRIANKLDSVLAKVDAAQARLEKNPTLLKRFRQSVLAAAISGELTSEWRENNSLPITENINFEKLWDEEYKKQGRRFKPTLIPIADDAEMDIPPTWQLTTLGEVCDVFVGATPSRKESSYWNGNINWVSSSEVAFCRISDTKEKITAEGLKHTSTSIHPVGTVMLAMIGQGKTRGQAAILDIEACHNQNTAALRILNEYLLPEYLYFFLWCQYEQTRKIGGGNNQQALNKSTVQGIEFPYPPLTEQKEIVRRVESLFAQADAVEKQYLAAKQRLDRLSQSLLAKAFRGELVPQDHNDEPAAELLKRIQAERQQQAADKPSRKTGKRDNQNNVVTNQTKTNIMQLKDAPETYLLDLLAQLGGESHAEVLWKKSELAIDDFYAKLKQEMLSNRILEDKNSPDPALRKLKVANR